MSTPAPPLPRREFPVCERWHYLNHAGVTALPRTAVRAMAVWAGRASEEGALGSSADEERAEEVRALAAAVMGVEPAEVAFVKNTTEGLGFVAHGLSWRPGDRVVVPDREFPSTIYPWLSLRDEGVVVDTVKPMGTGRTLPLEAFEEVMEAGPAPKVVALSWVQFGRGFRADVEALAEAVHRRGALLCLDAIQGLGVLPARLGDWGVDFAMADAHKWLLGPSGIGVLYVRRSLTDRLRPLEPGWASVAHREQWDDLRLIYDDSARRFEGGTANFAGIFGLGATLELLERAGIEQVWTYVDTLCASLCEQLEAAGAEVLSDRSAAGRSAIVTFEVPGRHPADVVGHLEARQVVVAARGDGVRASLHAYNDPGDVEALVAAVRELTGS